MPFVFGTLFLASWKSVAGVELCNIQSNCQLSAHVYVPRSLRQIYILTGKKMKKIQSHVLKVLVSKKTSVFA